MPTPIPKEVTDKKSVVIVMGHSASMGYSAYRPTKDDSLTWWSLYETEEPPSKKEVPREIVSKMLQNMYGGWKEENVQKVLKKASAPFIYPIWTVPELPTWGDDGVVLVGDAAHAITPDIGQGTSQAFEDSEALGLLLGRALQQEGISDVTAVDLAVKGLFECRQPRLSKIKYLNTEAQKHSGKRNIWVQKVIFLCMWIRSSFPWLRKFGKISTSSNSNALLTYSGAIAFRSGHEIDRILFSWDSDAETRKTVDKLYVF